MNALREAAKEGNTNILLRVRDWAQYILKTEDININVLLATNNEV